VVTDLHARPDVVAVANRLRPALLRLNRELRSELAALGVTGGQTTVLWLIRESPGIGVRELAARESISSPGMSGHVDRLEQAGLVTRVPSDTDRRRVGLYLTDEGRRVLDQVRRRRTHWLAKRLDRLGDDELRAVDAALDPLLALLEEEPT
jgi:DNA-binding MarR family transcriptional regulator